MEIHQLRYFVAVAELENFTRAAEQCNVTQPSLSQQIAKLERDLDTRLLDRLGRGVVLTDSGQELLVRARRILEEVDQAEAIFQRGEGLPSSSVSLGALPTIAPFLLPGIVERFRRELPEANLTVVEDYTDNLLARLYKGTLDLAIVALPIEDPRLDAQPLFREPLLVALPESHPLAEKKNLSLDQVREEPFLLLHEVHCLGEQIMGFCRQHEFRPRVVCESAQISTIQEMIRLGLGISLLPRMAVQEGPAREGEGAFGGCVYRPIRKLQPFRTIACVWNRHRVRSGSQQHLLEQLKRLEED